MEKIAVFELLYGSLKVGEFVYTGDEWQFAYSAQFKVQDKLKPYPSFPVVDKVYRSKQMFPFLYIRIPGKNQPIMQEAITTHGALDEVEVLKLFGQRCVDNEYVLNYVK